jgi:hypothetical protein
LLEIKLPKAALKYIQAFIPRLFVPHVKKLHTVATAESEEIGKEPLKEGDVVEAFFANDGWFKGRVTSISRRRGVGIKFAITFEDGDYQVMKPSDVRKFDHYKMGEQVEDVASSQEGTISYIYANGRVAVDTVDAFIRYPDKRLTYSVIAQLPAYTKSQHPYVEYSISRGSLWTRSR